MALDALGTFDLLRDFFFRYYDTPFSVLSKGVQRERRALLDRDLVSYREPWHRLDGRRERPHEGCRRELPQREVCRVYLSRSLQPAP